MAEKKQPLFHFSPSQTKVNPVEYVKEKDDGLQDKKQG